MGLSEQVRQALPHAVRAVEQILDQIGRIEQVEQEEGAHDGVQAD